MRVSRPLGSVRICAFNVQVSSIADVARSRSFDADPNHIGEREGNGYETSGHE